MSVEAQSQMPSPAEQWFDRGFHIEVLKRRLFAGDDHVHIVPAAQAVVRDREQRIGVGRKIDTDDIRFLVHDVVDESGVLVRESRCGPVARHAR